MATTELEIMISGGRVTNVKILADGKCRLNIEVQKQDETLEDLQKGFVRVEASKLTLTDKFLEYEPKTQKESELKKSIIEAINKKTHDFIRPICDPSFIDDEKTEICYEFDKRPALGKSVYWWSDISKKYNKNSRLGTRLEYVAFLGILIKQLIEGKWSVEEAWNAVCNDSKELGHYWNSKNAKHTIEGTGARRVGSFYDLANTYKILADDNDSKGFWLAGGDYFSSSNYCPLADIQMYKYNKNLKFYGVGWIIIECNNVH